MIRLLFALTGLDPRIKHAHAQDLREQFRVTCHELAFAVVEWGAIALTRIACFGSLDEPSAIRYSGTPFMRRDDLEASVKAAIDAAVAAQCFAAAAKPLSPR